MAWNSVRKCLVWLACLLSYQAAAGTNEWTIKGPPGGFFRAFEASTTDPDVFYAAYSRSFHRSADGGETWTARHFVGEVIDIAVDPADGQRIYISVFGEGVLRSLDGGENFAQIAPAFPDVWAVGAGPNNTVYYASSSVFHRSTDGGTSFAAMSAIPQAVTQIVVSPTTATDVFAVRGSSFMRSTDGGLNWTEADFSGGEIYSLAALPDNHLVAATSNGLWVSNDGGVNWAMTQAGIYASVASDPSAPEVLVAPSLYDGTVLRTTDGGQTWGQLSGQPRRYGRRVLISAASPDRLLLASGQGIQISDDGGATWRYATRGPVSSSALLATTVAASSRVYAYTAEDAGGLFYSEDGSDFERIENFRPEGQHVVAVRPGEPDSIYAGGLGGLHRSTDGGRTWFAPLPDSGLAGYSIGALGFGPGDPDTMYATVAAATATPPQGFYRSVDGGNTWQERSTDLASVLAYSMAVDPADEQRIFLAGREDGTSGNLGGLYLSTNGGVNWTRVHFANIDVFDVDIDPSDSNRIYASTQAGLQISVDGGATFTPNDPFAVATGGGKASALAIDPAVPSTIYASSLHGYNCCEAHEASFVLRSVDRGATWEVLRDRSGETWFVDRLVLDSNTPSRIFVNTAVRGVATYEVMNDLAISISGHSGKREIGSESSFALRAVNSGPHAATGVQIRVELPAGLSQVVASPDRGSCSVASRRITCNVPVLQVAEEVDVQVSYIPSEPGLLELQASIVAHEGDDDTSNNLADALATAGEIVDLMLAAISPENADVNRGASVDYTVQLRNDGVDRSTATTLQLAVDDGLVLAEWPAGCSAQGTVANCEIGELESGDTRSITFSVEAASAGEFTISAAAGYGADAFDVDASNNSLSTTLMSRAVADLAVSVTDSANPVGAGTRYSYVVTISNLGPDAASNVVGTISAPGTVSSITPSQGTCTGASGNIQCVMGTLAANTSATIVIETSASAGSATLSASASTDSTDSVTGNDSAQRTTTVNAAVISPPSGGGANRPGGGGGGSGSTSLWLLAMLLAIGLMRDQHLSSIRGRTVP